MNIFQRKKKFEKKTIYIPKSPITSDFSPWNNLLMVVQRAALYFDALAKMSDGKEFKKIQKLFLRMNIKISDRVYLKRSADMMWDLSSQLASHENLGSKKGEAFSISFTKIGFKLKKS